MPNQLPQKPLSPHLQIYRLPLTAILSVLHRMTGILLSAGLIVLVSWLAAAAGNPESYQMFYNAFSHWIGQVLLIAGLGALYFHLCTGIRHLCWDAGYGFSLRVVDLSSIAVIAVTLLLTAGTWLMFILR